MDYRYDFRELQILTILLQALLCTTEDTSIDRITLVQAQFEAKYFREQEGSIIKFEDLKSCKLVPQ